MFWGSVCLYALLEWGQVTSLSGGSNRKMLEWHLGSVEPFGQFPGIPQGLMAWVVRSCPKMCHLKLCSAPLSVVPIKESSTPTSRLPILSGWQTIPNTFKKVSLKLHQSVGTPADSSSYGETKARKHYRDRSVCYDDAIFTHVCDGSSPCKLGNSIPPKFWRKGFEYRTAVG